MLLTIPTTPEKGEFQTYTLDVSDLIDLVTEEYYQDQDNWRRVIVAYKSLTGNQLNLLSFTPDGGDTLTKQGFFAPESFSFFGIQSISIIDKQNGTYILTSSEIPDVANYNIIFVSAGASFYDMVGINGAWLDISDDNGLIAVQSAYNSFYGARYTYGMVQYNTSGEFNDALMALVNNFKVDCYYFNADESIVYIVGQLGLSYLGETLPAIPVGPDYSATPPRLISINTVSLEVTYITTIKDTGAYYNMRFSSGSYVGNLVVDEDSNVAVMMGGGAVAGYNIVSGDLLWFKQAGFYDMNLGYRKVELYTAGSFLIQPSSYDGTSYAYYTPIKVNILTGDKDVSLPSAPNNPTYPNTSQWSLTPDKSKIIQQAGNDARFYVFDGTSWSARIDYNGTGGVYSTAMGVDNSYIYFLFQGGVKCDFTGAPISGFSLGVPFYVIWNRCVPLGDNLYVDGYKFSAITGARDTSYAMGGQYYYAKYGQNDSIYYMTTNMNIARYGSPYGYNFADAYYGGYVGIIDTTTREKVNEFPASWTNASTAFGPVFGPTGSEIVFVGREAGSEFKAFNYLTGVRDMTYPIINTVTNSISNYAKDGNFMYVVSQWSGDSANTFNVTDSGGTYNLVTKLMRFNMVTKLVDTAFLPNIPSPYTGTSAISFTDDYIYLCAFYTGVANFCRVNKVTQAVEVISPSTLGISSPATWNDAVRIRVTKIAPNKIVIYPDSSNLKFDDRPYIICSEDTLAQVGPQPTTISEFPRYYAFNTVNNELGGIFYSSDNTWHFSVFDMADNTKTTNIVMANDGNNTLAASSGYVLATGNMTFKPFSDAYLTYSTGFYSAGYRAYNGVVRMNPLGIINNE